MRFGLCPPVLRRMSLLTNLPEQVMRFPCVLANELIQSRYGSNPMLLGRSHPMFPSY
jgi:hypothetical protein